MMISMKFGNPEGKRDCPLAHIGSGWVSASDLFAYDSGFLRKNWRFVLVYTGLTLER